MKTTQRATILQRLEGLHQKGLHRSLEPFAAAGARLPGNALNFCANDYLNLAQHPKVQEQGIYAIRHYGCSSASSRLLSGHLELHQQLEERLAAWSGYEAALCFGSGYLANCGILQAVLEPGAFVLFDRPQSRQPLSTGCGWPSLSQASQASQTLAGLADPAGLAGQKSGAQIEWQRYRHCDMSDLERRAFRRYAPCKAGANRTIWIVSESVFQHGRRYCPALRNCPACRAIRLPLACRRSPRNRNLWLKRSRANRKPRHKTQKHTGPPSRLRHGKLRQGPRKLWRLLPLQCRMARLSREFLPQLHVFDRAASSKCSGGFGRH